MINSYILKASALCLAIATLCTSDFAQNVSKDNWESAAGGAKTFDVASVRPAAPGQFTRPSFSLGPDDSFNNTGGRFTAVFPLTVYVEFAYKLWLSNRQLDALFAKTPAWTRTENFTIQANTNPNATKDQMRLMMQALLAERFGLRVHSVYKRTSVLAMVLAKQGKLGSKLLPHQNGPSCHQAIPMPASEGVPEVFPLTCDTFGTFFDGKHPILIGARNVTLSLIAKSLTEREEVGRPIVDETGLHGRFDFTLTWAYNPPGTQLSSNSTVLQAPDFTEALRQQLGIRLVPDTISLPTLVIDGVHEPTPN